MQANFPFRPFATGISPCSNWNTIILSPSRLVLRVKRSRPSVEENYSIALTNWASLCAYLLNLLLCRFSKWKNYIGLNIIMSFIRLSQRIGLQCTAAIRDLWNDLSVYGSLQQFLFKIFKFFTHRFCNVVTLITFVGGEKLCRINWSNQVVRMIFQSFLIFKWLMSVKNIPWDPCKKLDIWRPSAIKF